ncbi:MAG: efflux RND transporter periplasmic adaptor subunit [Rubinisphaera brasiliensis]|uniref:efflux RND transporter periplasmic adaptor subunit n=1 Tax=Rubinisphaera brasiliensis TaxID=119 RepID=UPI00391AC3D9
MNQINQTTESPVASRPATRSPQRPRRGFRAIVSILAILLILVGGVGASMFVSSLREPPRRAEPVERIRAVQVFETRPMTVQEMITGFGTARCMQQVVVSAQVSGEIVETLEPFKVGQAVQAANVKVDQQGRSVSSQGDVIARIDPQNYQEKLDQAEDRLKEDQAELDRLAQEKQNLQKRLQIQQRSFDEYQKEYDRVSRLVQQGVLSESNLTTAELDLRRYEDSKVQLETELSLLPVRIQQIEARARTHRNDLELAQLELDRTTIRSPISGRFQEIHVERGQYVSVGSPLVTVVNSRQVEIPIGIRLHDYQKLSARITSGDYPEVELRANRNDSFVWKGVVSRAAPVADASTRTVEVYVVVDNDEFETPLLPGTFVTVSIDGPVYENVYPIPRDTVYQGQVFLAEDGKAVRRDVEQRTVLESISLIENSLQPGDAVIMTNLDILEDGDKIRIADEGTQSLKDELLRLRLPTLRVIDPGTLER